VILGLLLAVVATVCSGSGSVLESIGVRRAGAYGGRSADLVGVFRQPMYFAGLAIDLVGFGLAAAALQRLPLFLVQALLAFSVGITAVLSAFLGARLAGMGWAALAVGAVGLALLGVSADLGPGKALPLGWRFVLLLMPIPIAGLAVLARRKGGRWSAQLLAFGAGLGFCAVGVAARTLVVPDPFWRVGLDPAVWALATNGTAAAVLFAMSLQRSGATAVTAIMFTTSTALSSLIGVAYLDDRVRSGFTVIAVIGFCCAVVGSISASHYAARQHIPEANPTEEATPAGRM
jgi:drug/metabolite transporter (DMT)-like permease